MPKVYVQRIKLKGREKVYEQFRTAIPKWVIRELKITHKDKINFKFDEKSGKIFVFKEA
jgi:bifunctional DNA-binding transcriptional regulator/antitoxin component of YhaV-PrlF toxin-antitoxin module